MANLMRLWARWCARRVVHLWEAPEVVVAWLDRGDEELRNAASAAAARTSDVAHADAHAAYAAFADHEVSDAAHTRAHAAYATYAAAYSACDSTTFSASVGIYNSAAVVGPAAVDAICFDSFCTPGLREKSKKEQQESKVLIGTLSRSLTGLSSLRLDIAHSDPWLTREVWRALERPDMQFVEDWYAWTQERATISSQPFDAPSPDG